MSDDDFIVEFAAYQHPKFEDAGPAASWLWLQCGLWSRHEKTDGFVPTGIVRKNGTLAQAKRLVAASLWVEEEGGFRFLLWRDHMGSPENAAKERRRARDREYRRQKRAAEKGDTSPVGNVGTVSARQSARRRHDVGTTVDSLDMTSSLEVPPLSPPQGGAPQAAPTDETSKPRARARKIPDDFSITPAMRAWAQQHVPDLDIDAALIEFTTYWAGRGAPMIDWAQTWRNGMLKTDRRGDFRRKPGSKPAPSRADLKPFTYQS